MRRTGKGEWEREWATLVEGRGENSNPFRVYIGCDLKLKKNQLLTTASEGSFHLSGSIVGFSSIKHMLGNTPLHVKGIKQSENKPMETTMSRLLKCLLVFVLMVFNC